MKKHYAIGIDPGAHIGWAVYCAQEKRFIEILTFHQMLKFHSHLMEFYTTLSADTVVTFYLEATDKINYVWDAPNRPLPTDPGEVRKALRLARNVGMNQGQCREIRNILNWYHLECRDIIPRYRSLKPQKGKMAEGYFRKISGWTGKLSQHGIDAAMLVIGR